MREGCFPCSVFGWLCGEGHALGGGLYTLLVRDVVLVCRWVAGQLEYGVGECYEVARFMICSSKLLGNLRLR